MRGRGAAARRWLHSAHSLEGVGTSLLAARLKQLESDGVVRRRELPPPAASTVYELTEAGGELADALVPLASWGARHGLGESRLPGQGFRPEWSLAMVGRALQRSWGEHAPVATLEFTVDGEVAVVTVSGHVSTVAPGVAEGAVDASITTDSATLAAVVAGRVQVGDAVASGRIRARGDEQVLIALTAALSEVTRPATPTRAGTPARRTPA